MWFSRVYLVFCSLVALLAENDVKKKFVLEWKFGLYLWILIIKVKEIGAPY